MYCLFVNCWRTHISASTSSWSSLGLPLLFPSCIMTQVPAALNAGVLAAHLDGIQGANVDAVAPAPAQPAVQEPQPANLDQPAQGQPHEAQQAPEVFFGGWVFACISPPCFLRFLSSFGFCSVLVCPTCRVLFHLWNFVLGSHVVCPGLFFLS